MWVNQIVFLIALKNDFISSFHKQKTNINFTLN